MSDDDRRSGMTPLRGTPLDDDGRIIFMPQASDKAALQAYIARVLSTMPEEAFTWLVLSMLPSAMTRGAQTQIWPDGIGGFREDSRGAIEHVRAAAQRWVEP